MADIAEEYRSSLSELNFNSKPHINMLTMLAEENIQHAALIVKTIVDHINSVTPDIKLPSLYLVDSIVKNIGKAYVVYFSKDLVSMFASVFEKGDENIRSLLYKLRSTWTNIFPNAVLLQLDRKVVTVDPAWPILAQPSLKNIHVNPKFLDKPSVQLPKVSEPAPTPQSALLQEVEMKKKQLELLLSLQKKKKQLEQLKLKAALTPAVVESAKVETKKPINTRDPRLTKKVSAASTEIDSTVLHSVVVVPKANDSKKTDKASLSPPLKRIKQEEVHPKKHLKSKLNSNTGELEDNNKLNVDADVNKNVSSQTFDTQKNSRGKKRCSDGVYVESNKTCKKFAFHRKLDVVSRGTHFKQLSFDKPNNSDQLFKHDSGSRFINKVTDENHFRYEQQPNLRTEVFDKNVRKLEPPPPPPLFLGTEDKDYRVIPKKVEDRKFNETTYQKCRYSNNYAKNRNFRQNTSEGVTVPVVKSFKLDNKDRKVFFVNDRSFAFMDDNVPRELTFEGPPRLVFIEGCPQPIELGFGGHVVKFEVDGKYNFIKFGTPAREVYINEQPYEAEFGGPPFRTVLSNDKAHMIRINGPLPQVILSNTPAFELYDKFCQNNKEFLQRFDNEPNINNDMPSHAPVGNHDVDMRMNNAGKLSSFFNFPLEKMNDVNWQKVHIGNSQTEWNKPINSFETCKDRETNFIPHQKFSEVPEWNRTAPVSEVQHSTLIPPPLPPKQLINRYPGIPSSSSFGPTYSGVKTPLLQLPTKENPKAVLTNNMSFPRPVLNSADYANPPDRNSMCSSSIRRLSPPPLPPFMGGAPSTACTAPAFQIPNSVAYNNTTVQGPMPPTSAPLFSIPPPNYRPHMAVNNLTTCTQISSLSVSGTVPSISTVQANTSSTSTVSSKAPVNINLFLEKLVAAGLIGSNSGTSATSSGTTALTESQKIEEAMEEPPKEVFIPEIRFESKSLKEFHAGVITALFNGSQCATCGMRFKEIQSEQYSRHLDWHFRRNRREKDGVKKPFSRRWYYEIKDWIEFKEFEDVDERAPSYFELQANVDQPEEVLPENVSSVPCNECESEKCAVCGEQFQLFWVEEEEEWHLRNAVKHEDEVYHPACYEDFKKASESVHADLDTSIEESSANVEPSELEPDATDDKVKVEELDIHVKEEPECDAQMKDDTDIDVTQDVQMKDETDIDVKNDVQMKGETDIDVRKDVQMKDETDIDVRKDVQIKEETELEVDVIPTSNVILKEKDIKLDLDFIKDSEEIEQDIRKEIEEMAKNPETEKLEQDIREDIEKLAQNATKVEAQDLDLMKETVSDSNVREESSLDSIVTKQAEEDIEIQKSANEMETDVDTIKDGDQGVAKELDHKETISHPTDSVTKNEENNESESVVPQCFIKVESVDSDGNKSNDKPSNEKSETAATDVETNSDITLNKSNIPNTQSQSLSQVQNVPIKFEDELDEIEFRPPTPDPRFQVLPPVMKGEEISNLCTIM